MNLTLAGVILGTSTPLLLAGETLAATLPNLAPGSQFRYVFVTSETRDPSSTDISDYNTFVNNVAVLGTETSNIQGDWKAIVSTATTNAKVNTNTLGDAGVPIFRVDGVKVADDYSDLWDFSIDNPINITENGVVGGTFFVYTGSPDILV
ncbi:hypothetical protein VB715_07970 [Crocosphaera sp. UHCC 0190]|uniref:hypothetical protein n=1 Tax=Crocosphaera sp. UHCC 0190 TaxID=3110246 RepID=UPI002B2189F0|nr:hypothetical protein [Crocosphaera sp. UHCC 0190]MEA5509699.1 hypothetical protein [Crocosphaera sp. UHCC 0190]